VTANLYPDTPCPACGKEHALSYHDPSRHPRGAVYRYTCPAAGVVVSFRPTKVPQPVILAPAVAIPLTWVSD
jgi:hypothetical protein